MKTQESTALNMPGSYVITTDMAFFDYYKSPAQMFAGKVKDICIPMEVMQSLKDELLTMGVTSEMFEFRSANLSQPGNMGGTEHVHIYDVTALSPTEMRQFAANFTRGRIGEGEPDNPDNWSSCYIRIRGGLTVRKLATLMKKLDEGVGGTIGK